jgi:hypothetical protein
MPFFKDNHSTMFFSTIIIQQCLTIPTMKSYDSTFSVTKTNKAFFLEYQFP